MSELGFVVRQIHPLTDPKQIVFDFHQLPRESLPQLRDTLLSLLATFAKGPKPIRTQLCVCLANLAIQMLEWKDVLPMVVSTLGSDANSLACVLDFLRVLPEEVTEGRKINLTVRPVTTPTHQRKLHGLVAGGRQREFV